MASDSRDEWASADGDAPHESQPEATADLRVMSLDDPSASAEAGRRAWRWGLRLGGGLALLTLIAVAAVALSPLLPRPAAPAPPKPPLLNVLTLQVPDNARECLGAAAWSPDGARVAFVRDSLCDPHAATEPTDPSALVFDATTGKLENTFSLAGKILAGAPAGAQVVMRGVIWTPRGDQIAVPYTIFAPGKSGEGGDAASADGLALLTVRGAHIDAFTDLTNSPPSETVPNPLALNAPYTVSEWNLLEFAIGQRQLTVAPAYGYHWNPDGSLAPILLSSSQPDDRKDTVSMWRNGQLWLVNALRCETGQETFLAQPYVALSLSRLAWSPDGAWLVELSAGARYPLPAGAPEHTPHATPATCASGPASEHVPQGPEPDKGLRAAAQSLVVERNVSVSLDWRPDSKRLVAFTFNVGSQGSAILIYDCATGTLMRRYTAGQVPNTGQPGTGPAKNFSTIFTGGDWSPDGQRLLVEAAGNGALPFILGPHALGE